MASSEILFVHPRPPRDLDGSLEDLVNVVFYPYIGQEPTCRPTVKRVEILSVVETCLLKVLEYTPSSLLQNVLARLLRSDGIKSISPSYVASVLFIQANAFSFSKGFPNDCKIILDDLSLHHLSRYKDISQTTNYWILPTPLRRGQKTNSST